MRSDQFRRMLREQKEVVEAAFEEVVDCDQLSSYQRTIMCSQLLRELSLSSRKIAMTLRHKAKQAAPLRSGVPFADDSNVILLADRQPANGRSRSEADLGWRESALDDPFWDPNDGR